MIGFGYSGRVSVIAVVVGPSGGVVDGRFTREMVDGLVAGVEDGIRELRMIIGPPMVSVP